MSLRYRWCEGPVIWLEIGGRAYGLLRDNGMPPLFSERYGYKKVTRFFGFKFVREAA